MSDFQELLEHLNALGAESWVNVLPGQLSVALAPKVHGQLHQWQRLIAELPEAIPSCLDINAGTLKIGIRDDLTEKQQVDLLSTLQTFHPWRKGPFNLFGIEIETEWHSDWKWQRLIGHITPLDRRAVLDIGCGNGYHCWRMRGAGAKLVVGVDPLALNALQFQLIKKLYGPAPVYVLPLGIEALPAEMRCFDTVFSMGVLYHRRSPIDHLLDLRDCLQPGGELVLETLIIDGRQGEVLVPEGRYAKMRNVWFIPSVDTLLLWLRRCGFKNSRVVDINQTSTEEQRSTEWMRFQSLKDFLDPNDPTLTGEGLPAPKRAIFIANT